MTAKSLLLPVLLLFSSLISPAQESQTTTRLLAAVASARPGDSVRIALELDSPKPWHTYWINPEGPGTATSVRWVLPEGWTAGELEWAAPARFSIGGFITFGYEGRTMLYATVKVPANAPEGPARLTARVTWLECDDESCNPGSSEISLTLPINAAAPAPSPQAAEMARQEARLPAAPTGWSFSHTREGKRIRITAIPPQDAGPVAAATFFPYEGQVFSPDEPQKWTWGAPASFELVLQEDATLPGKIEGVLVSESGWPGLPPGRKAIEISSSPGAGPASASGSEGAAQDKPAIIGVWAALLGGLLGGLLLNLMPCVFPVISIKVMGFVESAHGDPRKALRHALIFTLGVLVCFWALAALLLQLKGAGEELGWGYQMQNPKVILGIAVLFTLMACNLFGVFEVGGSLTGVGSGLAEKSGWKGAFFSGVLAVIVATPCTAPFLGAAGGYALTQATPAVSMLVFTAIALGMALPYVVLTSSPRMMKFVPRPGEWMVTFKQFMGFFMLAFVVYLLWVFGEMRKVDGLVRLVTGLFIVALAAWVYGRLGALHQPALKRRLATVAAVGMIAGGSYFANTLPKDYGWKPWTPELAAQLRAKGQPFFIDYTAAWCLSCQLNKKAALNREEVTKAFADAGVVKLVADWTDKNPVIARALAEHNRAGVPLYLLYGRDPAQPPRILPEVLTPGIVLDALREMKLLKR